MTSQSLPSPEGTSSNGDRKRKATEELRQEPIRRPRRQGPKPVLPQRLGFHDSISTRVRTKEEILSRLAEGAKRAGQIEKHGLLYKYERIKPTEMRLLIIKPAPRRDMDLIVSIRTLRDIDVGEDPLQEYEALSYHWGPGPADRPVFLEGSGAKPKIELPDLLMLMKHVPDFSKGQRFYVRPNLDQALRYLRHKKEPVVLWVDAICINQSDEKGEKPEQIAKMKHIYSKAENVCIWLGNGKGEGATNRTEDFHSAMDFVRNIIELKNLQNLVQDKSMTKSWSDLFDLIRCSWFSRRWVIQELALARVATVHVADKHLLWQDFADAIGLFALNFDSIRALFRQSRDNKIFGNYRHFNELAPLGAKVLVDAITNTFRKSVDGSTFEPVSDLETLVSNLTFFESSDPRDTIYALLNIARETMMTEPLTEYCVLPPKPDYERDILEVYTDFLEWVVFSTNSLDILCRHWAMPERTVPGGRKNPTPLMKLPSWIQEITKSSWGFQEQGFNGRLNGDSIVGKAGRRRYNASRWMKPEVQFGDRRRPSLNIKKPGRANTLPTFINGKMANPYFIHTPPGEFGPRGKRTSSHRLHVYGIEIGTIDWSFVPISRGVIPKDCLEKGGWTNDAFEQAKVPDKVWRTLVADKTAEGENPPPWYHRAAMHCMALADNNGHIATSELLEREDPGDSELPKIVTEYLKRVQAVTWNRTFFEADPQAADLDPLFGIGPPDLQKNDCVCILFGCSVPVILRRHTDTERKDTVYYSLIGEAYVYGRMDGEAITMLGDDQIKMKKQLFTII